MDGLQPLRVPALHKPTSNSSQANDYCSRYQVAMTLAVCHSIEVV